MIGSRSPVPLLLAAVLLLGLAFAPHAAGSIYWANDKGDTIGHANLDGRGANQSFITGGQPRSASPSTERTSTGRAATARSAAPTSTAAA